MANPLVSICCITFNHELYIQKCLDGFIEQKTDFDIEILIHDDASTDKTADIIREYEKKYPEIIKPIYQTENQYLKGVRPINKFNFERAQGKYIALCEGDDYWADPLKLQKQVDFLEDNPGVKICCHPSFMLYDKVLKQNGYGYWGDTSKIISAEQAILNYITSPFQALLFRNEKTEDVVKIIKHLLGGHSAIQIFYALPNGIGYLPDYMAVYRVNSSSSVSKTLFRNDKDYLKRQIKNLQGLEMLNEYSEFRFNKSFQKSIRLRVLGYIKTGFLSWHQILILIKDYQLFKEPYKLLSILKDQLILSLKKLLKNLK